MDLLAFFLSQHAAVHARDVGGRAFPAQRVFEATEEQMRLRPGKGHPWLGWTRGEQLASSALRHNAAHIGEAVTIRGLAGIGLGV